MPAAVQGLGNLIRKFDGQENWKEEEIADSSHRHDPAVLPGCHGLKHDILKHHHWDLDASAAAVPCPNSKVLLTYDAGTARDTNP